MTLDDPPQVCHLERMQEDTPDFPETVPQEGPHHFHKHSECSFTFAEGLAPVDQELSDLRDQVKFLQEALQKKESEPDEDAEMYFAAYQRMRENFQVSLNTIRQLEDALHVTRRELEDARAQIKAAQNVMRVTG